MSSGEEVRDVSPAADSTGKDALVDAADQAGSVAGRIADAALAGRDESPVAINGASLPPEMRSLLPDTPSPSAEVAESPSDPVERDQRRSGSSRLASPDDVKRDKKKGSVRWSSVGPTQSARHLPLARDQALNTFTEIKSNNYQNNKVGRSKGHEKDAMTCECRYKHGIDDPMMACGEDAACINRLTQVECRESDCNCGKHCRNQRFQKHQYADVEIVQTEKKGFGLRSRSDMTSDTFIYEYIGEVVEQGDFMNRMQQYKDEGIRHYYFMMLQREEFIDATKKGAIARFINHSCNPNCYVAKWHVGKHMRMGIFSKRDIVKGEELTFNYNVDRYGNEAQPCYCGEPNCVGSIGGKTQTDIGGMDQLFIDALGIADEVDRIGARGTRKKKSRHLDDEDFNPTLHPMKEEEVAKVTTAIRQTASNRTILQKLLNRVHMTQDTDVQRSLVRLHGFSLMAGVLGEWKDDKEILLLALGSLARWPLLARNKVVDSGIDMLVKEMSRSEDAEISSISSELLKAWETLEMSYRIARREANGDGPTISFEPRHAEDVDGAEMPLEEAKAPNTVSEQLDAVAPRPLVRALGTAPRNSVGSTRSQSNLSGSSTPVRQRFRSEGRHDSPSTTPAPQQQTANRQAMSIEDIIRKANEATEAQRKKAAEAASAAAEAAVKAEESRKRISLSAGLKRRSSSKPSETSNDKKRRVSEPNQEREAASRLERAESRLKKLIGEIVVRCMSSFKEDLDREKFKKHAKELTTIICEKEKRNPKVWPPRGPNLDKFLPDGFTTEKRGKIKAFASDYVQKLVTHKGGRGYMGNGSAETPASTSHSHDTPQEHNKDDDEQRDDDNLAVSDGDAIVDSPMANSPHPIKVPANAISTPTASTATTASTDHAAPETPQEPVANHAVFASIAK